MDLIIQNVLGCQRPHSDFKKGALKILVAITGASGSIYAQRLMNSIPVPENELHFIQSRYAKAVALHELQGASIAPPHAIEHSPKSMNLPFASGSNPPDVMVIVPCSMGTLARIAAGTSDDALLRSADVVLKERKKLILALRGTPIHKIHLQNMERAMDAGAIIMPASPHFYNHPQTVEDVADTVVARILDHMGIENALSKRWSMSTEAEITPSEY